jgi:hypothetical protein
LKERVTRLWRLMGVPTRVGNTKSQSRQFDKLLALFNLAFAVFLEGFHVLGGKLHGTTAFRRLGSAEDGFAVFDAREGALYAQDAMIEVYVLPLEA